MYFDKEYLILTFSITNGDTWFFFSFTFISFFVKLMNLKLKFVDLRSSFPLRRFRRLYIHTGVIGIIVTQFISLNSLGSMQHLLNTSFAAAAHISYSWALAYTRLTCTYMCLMCRYHREVYNYLGMSLLNTHQETQLGIELTKFWSHVNSLTTRLQTPTRKKKENRYSIQISSLYTRSLPW